MGIQRGTVAASRPSPPVNLRRKRNTEQGAPMESRPPWWRAPPDMSSGPWLLGLLLFPWTLQLTGTLPPFLPRALWLAHQSGFHPPVRLIPGDLSREICWLRLNIADFTGKAFRDLGDGSLMPRRGGF